MARLKVLFNEADHFSRSGVCCICASHEDVRPAPRRFRHTILLRPKISFFQRGLLGVGLLLLSGPIGPLLLLTYERQHTREAEVPIPVCGACRALFPRKDRIANFPRRLGFWMLLLLGIEFALLVLFFLLAVLRNNVHFFSTILLDSHLEYFKVGYLVPAFLCILLVLAALPCLLIPLFYRPRLKDMGDEHVVFAVSEAVARHYPELGE